MILCGAFHTASEEGQVLKLSHVACCNEISITWCVQSMSNFKSV